MNEEDSNSRSGDVADRTRDGAPLHALPDAFFDIDAAGMVKQHISGAEDDPVLRPAMLVGRRFAESLPGPAADLIARNIRRALKSRSDQTFRLELDGTSGSGLYEVRLLVKGRDRLLAVFRRIGVEADETRLPSFCDTLTGLGTRAHFLNRFESVLADARLRERGLALMCIDIDRFGRINDTLGRQVGDAVLKATARRIRGCFRDAGRPVGLAEESDGVARVGADEFVVVLTGIESREDVIAVADRIQRAFAKPITYEGHSLKITPSIGIAQFPVDGSDAEILFGNARAALDEAKTHGEDGRAFYSGTMQLRALRRFDQKDELRWAMERNQLSLHYLPRIDLTNGQVIGLEALLRWTHSLRGNVPLEEIIPLAEATGLMLPIGEWILDQACEQAGRWAGALEFPPRVSVNLSQPEFFREDLAELISLALARHGLPGDRLQLDLKEIMLMRHARASRVLEELNALGVRLVIDDFGTGHSSLVRLKSLPIDALKIDRSFVEGIEAGGDKRAICGAIIAMARELGFRVVAEGVETDAQLAFLQARGCHAAQGFFYSKPLPADEVIGFVQAWSDAASDATVARLAIVREQVAE